MKKIAALLILIAFYSQVGINTTTPTATLDVLGNVKLNAQSVSSADSILVIQNREIKKISLSAIQIGKCPNFLSNQSSGYHLKFNSPSSVPNPNNPLIIQGKHFTPSGSHISNNTYFFSWTNTTGQPININSFTVDFSGLVCNY